MEKFLVLYRAPNAVIDEWMKKPEQERKPEETKMMDAWQKWMSAKDRKNIFKHGNLSDGSSLTGINCFIRIKTNLI